MYERPPDVTLDGADRQTGGGSNLRVTEIAEERQPQDHSLLGGQPIEFVADHDPIDHPIHRLGFRRRRRNALRGGDDLPVPVERCVPIGDQPSGDAQQPCPERATLRVEPVPALPGPDEDLLDEFLRVVMIAEPEHPDPLHHPAVPVERLTQCTIVAGSEPGSPFTVCQLLGWNPQRRRGGTGHESSVGHGATGTAVMAMLSSYPSVELSKVPPQVINTSREEPPRSKSRSSGTWPLDHSSRETTENSRVRPDSSATRTASPGPRSPIRPKTPTPCT